MNNFKKIVSFVLAFSGMMNVFSVSFAETVQNSAIPGWSVEYADDASGSTAFENGENSDDLAVVINSTGTGICKIKQMVETEPGKKYECSVRVKTKNLSGGYIYAGGQKRDIRDGSNNWSEYKFVFAAENEESEIGVALNDTGSVIVDSFKIKDESGNPIKVANSDFKEEGKSTSSTSVSVSESVDMNKEVLSKEEVPYFYSTQKKVPIFYADNITIDGESSDWEEYPSVYMPADSSQVAKLKSWDGINDLSANVYLAYDDESFYLCAVVDDDEHCVKKEQYWAGDCLQLGFTNNGNYGPEIGIFFDEGGNYIDSPIGKESEMAFVGKRTGTKSIYEYKIPWKLLYEETPEDHIVFNVLVDDADNSVRQAFVEWTDGIGYAKSPDSITLQFVPKEDSGFAAWIDAPEKLTVGQSQTIYVNLFNRGEEAQKRNVKISSLDFEKEVETEPGTIKRIPIEYTAENVGTDNLSVLIEGNDSSVIRHSIKVEEKEKYQNMDLSNIENGKLSKIEALINECKSRGIATDYEELDFNVIKRFSNYYYDDIEAGFPERATYVANNLERLADEAIENLTAYLAGTKQSSSVPKYLGGDLEVDGFSVVSETKDSLTGEVTKRPVFLGGYGHTTDARNDLLDLPNYGANIFQHELGVYHTVVGYSQTPDAENIMDRFIFSDKIYNERIVPVIERATATNQAVDLILSPHYFPKFVQEKHPETIAPNQKGMNKNINLYAEKSKEVVEAHVRYFLNKIKDVPIIKSICLTNEPAQDVRNCYEPGNMNNNVTAAWVAYLEETYKTISRLNKYYKSDYSSFEEVPMISVVANDVPTYDWLIFNNKMFADWHEWLAGIVHEIMPNVPVHSKIMNMVFDNGAFSRATDPELFAKFSGFSGNDAYFCYPASSPLGKYEWYDLEGSIKRMPIFDSENHIITDKDDDFVPEHAYQNGTDIWQGAIHGRSLTCIWVWGRDNNPKSVLNGSLLFRPDVVSKIGKNILDLNRLSYEAAALCNEPYRVRVLYSWTSRVYSNAANGTTNTAYKGATYTGEKTGFITENQLADRDFADCDIIIVPYIPNTHEESVAGLKEFMEQGGKVFIMDKNSLLHDERNDRIHSSELEYVQKNAVYWEKTGENDISNYLYEYYDENIDIGRVRVIDINTGEPVKNVEWRSTEYDGHTIINLCNYTWSENKEVYITVDGKCVSDAYDLKSSEELSGLITLNSYEPRLIRVDEKSDKFFEDVKGHWAQDYIERMSLRGILSGVGNNMFMPDKSISAQELLMALIKYNGYECDYSKVFETAQRLWNIDEKFFEKTELTREEVAMLICAACSVNGKNSDISFFEDAGEISPDAYSAVAALYEMKAMTGRSDVTINPKDIFTRAEAVTVLSRLQKGI